MRVGARIYDEKYGPSNPHPERFNRVLWLDELDEILDRIEERSSR